MLKKFFDVSRRELKKLALVADKVLALENEYEKLTDEELQGKTEIFRERLTNGETLEDLLV